MSKTLHTLKKSCLALWLAMMALSSGIAHAQQVVPLSVRDIAPEFGIRSDFLDDTIHLIRYLETLSVDNHTLTDTCVATNARLMSMQNSIRYDFRHNRDTIWIDATTYLADYNEYSQRMEDLSALLLRRAHYYIEREHIRTDSLQQSAISLTKDSISRQHRTIVNACDGIGISDKIRQKELKDLYYAYLSVYNRYDFSMRRGDNDYINDLNEFSNFQKHIIANLLSNNNYSARINSFANTLRIRCGHNHTDVYRSYSRVFVQKPFPVDFSTIKEYYVYAEKQQEILDLQNCYLEVVDLREKITASNKRISSLYSPKFRDVAKTYDEVVSTINTVPTFTTMSDAQFFIGELKEFIQVQQCYQNDYDRIASILNHSDTISRRCSVHFPDVSKAYRTLFSTITVTPNYHTLDDAARYSKELDYIEIMQRQYDTIVELRTLIESTKDSINRHWLQHLNVYNGFQTIRKQYVLTPSFINVDGGHEFINSLNDCLDMENLCVEVINLYNEYKTLDSKVQSAITPYKNIRKAYNKLEKDYITIKGINHTTEMELYHQQLKAFITVQQAVFDKAYSSDAANADLRLKGIKENDKIELILGI